MIRRTLHAAALVVLALRSPSAAAQPTDPPATQPTTPAATQPASQPSARLAPAPAARKPSAPAAAHPAPASDDGDLFGGAPEAIAPEETAQQEPTRPPLFVLNGFIQGQVGLFTDPQHKNRKELDKDGDEYWVDHGDLAGKLSMLRGTLQLEGDFNPSRYASVHFVLRGVRSLRLKADEVHAAPPDGAAAGEPSAWVMDKYYNELDVRELYVDINPAPWINIRIGRQQVAWGDLGQYRLLDIINPTNATWHFANLEQARDQRIPLTLLKAMLDVRPLAGSLELVWVPMIDRAESTVSVPLTFVGAWGLPSAGPRDFKSSFKIKRKTPLYPGGDIEDTRLGVRWLGTLGSFSYSLVYYWTHLLSPPIATGFYQRWDKARGALESDVDVMLEFPRQHITGFSLEYLFKAPVSTVARLEASYTPNGVFSGASVPAGELVTDNFEVGKDLYTRLPTFQKHLLSYGVQLMRPTFIRWLNPNQTFMLVAQFLHSIILDYDEKERMVAAAGYDSTRVSRHSMTIGGAIMTSYLHGLLVPSVSGGYLPQGGAHSGFLSLRLGLVLGTSMRAALTYTAFFGQDAYKGLGLFRDRDEVNLAASYQF